MFESRMPKKFKTTRALVALVVVSAWMVVGISSPAGATTGSNTSAVALGELGANQSPSNGESPMGSGCNKYTGALYGQSSGCASGYGNRGQFGWSWCADFAKWVWLQSGVDTSGLTSQASSFSAYGQAKGTWHAAGSGYVPQPGDAAVYGSAHVGIVVSSGKVTPDVVQGNWNYNGDGRTWAVALQRNSQNNGGGVPISGYASPSGGNSDGGGSLPGAGGTPTPTVSFAANGGFEYGWGPWSTATSTGTNYVDYQSGQVKGEGARSGLHYAATNTSRDGGGIFEDGAVSASPGNVYCASAWVRTQYPATGARGRFVVWLLGGSYNENGVATFSGLSNGANWRQVQTCVSASTAHSQMRVQFYPDANSPTLDIDDVDVHLSMAANGGFEYGWGPWSTATSSGTNYVDYQSGQVKGEGARSGLHYAATNTSREGGGIFEDGAVSASPGNVYCASAWVRTQYPATGARGRFVVWLLGGSYNENGVATFSGLSNGASWRQVQTCVSASTAHSQMRVQFYPDANSPTLDIDDVDVHLSMAANGGFEYGWGPWSTATSSGTNYVDYQSGQVKGEGARSGLHYAATNTSRDGGGIFEDGAVSASPGNVYCASAWVRTQYPATGARGRFVVWLLGGSYNENGVATFSGLSNGANWRQVQTCVSASTAHSQMRIQFYPDANSPTLDIDDVDVH